MGPETVSDPQGESREQVAKMAELYINIAMTDVFANGAAITSAGVLMYPYEKAGHMDGENESLFNEGRITIVRSDEIGVEIKDPSHPPIIFLIPPRSILRLSLKDHKRGKRKLQPSVMLYHGLDESNEPITDNITERHPLIDGLAQFAVARLLARKIDPACLTRPPLTAVKDALVDICNTTGSGNVDEAVNRTLETKLREAEELIAQVEVFLDGNKK